jgi:hypothetical protein
MQLVADDPINQSIWTDSALLQRKIVEHETLPLRVGAQQAMPKACDQKIFSAQDPLPWVPDLVGTNFGNDPQSVLVVASSYNGFIEGYSGRDAVMPLTDYIAAKNAGAEGIGSFIRKFKEHVVDRDEAYYQTILRDLLPPAGCDLDSCCITDVCKASFVQRGEGSDGGNRGDKGNDKIVQTFWSQWILYVIGVDGDERNFPLPNAWLWQRMQRCHLIVALGTIAEYGVLKVFMRMATTPKVWSWHDNAIVPNHTTMTAQTQDWEYAYACSNRKLSHWLRAEDWWVLSDDGARQRWFLLPVHHPASAIGRGNDRQYRKTVPRLHRVFWEAVRVL